MVSVYLRTVTGTKGTEEILRDPAVPHHSTESAGGLGAVWRVVRGHTQLGASVSERSLLIHFLCSEVRTWSKSQLKPFLLTSTD